MAKITLSSNRPTKASPAAVWAALIAVYIIWGSTYLAIRFAVETIPPFFMAAVRFLIAGGVLFAWRRLAGDPAPRRFEVRSAAIIGLFLLVGGNGLVVWSEQTIPSGMAALMVSSAPLWMLLLEAVLPGGARPTKQAMLGVLAGFIGVALLVGPEKGGGPLKVDPLGAAALVSAALAWSFGSIISRYARLPPAPMISTSIEMLAGGIVLLIVSGLTGEMSRINLAAISASSALGLVYLILFGSLVGFSAYTWLLRVAPISLVSTYAYVNPLVALALGALIGNENVSPRTLIASLIIVGSVSLITVRKQVRNISVTESN